MPDTKPAALCTLVLLSGTRCRSVALRNQPYCRHHAPTHRLYKRHRSLGPVLDRLGDKIAAMNTSEFLYFLHTQLTRLPKTLSRFPEISFTLVAALERIDQITRMESDLKHQTQQSQLLLAKIREYQMNSGRCV